MSWTRSHDGLSRSRFGEGQSRGHTHQVDKTDIANMVIRWQQEIAEAVEWHTLVILSIVVLCR